MQQDPKSPDNSQTQPEAATSVRDSITAAVSEIKDREQKEVKVDLAPTDPKEALEPEVKKDDKSSEEVVGTKEVKTQPTKAEDDNKSKEVKKEEVQKETSEKKEAADNQQQQPKQKVPFGLPKDIRAKWDTYDADTQAYLSKVVKENLDTKASEGRRAHMRDVEQVLNPYLPAIQQNGVTPAQLVKRLLEYSDLLASPQYKYQAIQHLAHNFGIDLTLFGSQEEGQGQQQKTQQTQEIQNTQLYAPELERKVDYLVDKLNQQEISQRTVQQSANDRAAADYVNQWAGFNPTTNEYTNKPYFPYIRQTMFQLLSSGAVPIVDGQIDLDGAYEAACNINPEIRELIEEDRQNALRAEAAKRQQQQQQALQKAKLAGSSIRPGAPAPINRNINTKTINGKPLSVRDSIRQAVQEHRG